MERINNIIHYIIMHGTLHSVNITFNIIFHSLSLYIKTTIWTKHYSRAYLWPTYFEHIFDDIDLLTDFCLISQSHFSYSVHYAFRTRALLMYPEVVCRPSPPNPQRRTTLLRNWSVHHCEHSIRDIPCREGASWVECCTPSPASSFPHHSAQLLTNNNHQQDVWPSAVAKWTGCCRKSRGEEKHLKEQRRMTAGEGKSGRRSSIWITIIPQVYHYTSDFRLHVTSVAIRGSLT